MKQKRNGKEWEKVYVCIYTHTHMYVCTCIYIYMYIYICLNHFAIYLKLMQHCNQLCTPI